MHTNVRWFRAALLGLVAVGSFIVVSAQELYVRVVDVGAGECIVIKAPGPGGKDHYMIYDAGNYEDKGKTAMDAIRDIIPEGSKIDLLVLSHSDSDHIAAVPEICDEYHVRRVIHPGYERPTSTWRDSDQAILNEVKSEKKKGGCINMNLANVEVAPGSTYKIGYASATFVAGFHEPPEEWGQLSDSEQKNAGSIVIRLTYKGKSVLITGDAVGRHIGDPDNACIAIEKFMVDNAETVKIDSDVLIAAHHGADNGSSKPFIEEVTPEYVVFSAGHKFNHPRKSAADRFISAGVSTSKMFRTDRGDNEGGKEWDGQGGNSADQRGDDDVEIRISAAGAVSVQYRP